MVQLDTVNAMLFFFTILYDVHSSLLPVVNAKWYTHLPVAPIIVSSLEGLGSSRCLSVPWLEYVWCHRERQA